MSRLHFACLDCGVDTGRINEYYMVTDEAWLSANPLEDGMLCIGCLEGRLGRRLTPEDFTRCPLNTNHTISRGHPKSERLLERLGAGAAAPTEWPALVRHLIATRGGWCEDPQCTTPNRGADQRIYGDHITELKDGGAQLDPANVMLRCAPCHGRKTAQEAAKRMARRW
jgi:hypothetical protein